MFGGPSKLGRGGGAGRGVGGGHKRFPGLSQPIRSAAPPAGRLPMSGSRNRTPAPPVAPPAVEETFSLVSGKNPLAFAMIIRLAPDLIEEIRRVEAQGGAARIKFDANQNNPSGNVIDVGGKEFRFTWSKEFGDLCDIYEERESGEDGNGLLVESGSAWRKVNVQRVLDESTTNHVKMRSVEAERKKEQRKAIILDHGNPSMKSQIKQLAAAEANPWRTGFKKKEPPPKKRKVEPPHVPIKPAQKPGSTPSSSKPAGKGPCSASPPDPLQALPSPSGGLNNISKAEKIVPAQFRKEDASTSERDIPIKSGGLQDRSGSKLELGVKSPIDLQSMLTSLLKENPKGMSLKALEKAIGDTFPSSGKKLEPILKRIAIYQAPGRFLLKHGLEAEGTKGPSPGSASSFDDNNIQIPTFVSEPTFDKEVRQDEGLAELNTGELDASENIDIEQHSPDVLGGDKKDSRNGDSSSDSGSDSDSDSDSDSGSDSPSGSRSRSKSRSPVSQSGNSSSKEGSDEEVDIISSDDDKGPKPIQDPGPAFASLPMQNGGDGNDSDIVDIDGEINDEDGDVLDRTESAREARDVSPNQDEFQAKQNLIGSLFDEEENAFDDSFRPEPSERSDRTSRGKSKNMSALTVPATGYARYSSSPHGLTPDKFNPDREMPNRADKSQTYHGKHTNLHLQQQEQTLSGQILQPTSYETSWRINKHAESSGQVPQDKSFNIDPQRDKPTKGTPEGYGSRPTRDGHGGPGGRHSLPFGPSFKESPCVNGRGPVLQREVSDLELGELREPLPKEAPSKKQFERKGSFKQEDNIGKPLGRSPLGRSGFDAGKLSTPNSTARIGEDSENFSRKRRLEQRDDDLAMKAINVNGTAPSMKISEVKSKKGDAAQKIDTKLGLVPHRTKKETKTQAMVVADGVKRKESSSDENSCSYSKYEKDEPELKGRIKNLSQYYDYVQEYRDKYDSYCSLNKVLDRYRDDFGDLGRELEVARGRDMERYNNVLSQIMESYKKCGTKHKRLKKIFTVLHEELKHLKRMITDFAKATSKD